MVILVTRIQEMLRQQVADEKSISLLNMGGDVYVKVNASATAANETIEIKTLRGQVMMQLD